MIRVVGGGLVAVVLPTDVILLVWLIVYMLVSVGHQRAINRPGDPQRRLWLVTWLAATVLGFVITFELGWVKG